MVLLVNVIPCTPAKENNKQYLIFITVPFIWNLSNLPKPLLTISLTSLKGDFGDVINMGWIDVWFLGFVCCLIIYVFFLWEKRRHFNYFSWADDEICVRGREANYTWVLRRIERQKEALLQYSYNSMSHNHSL